MSSRSIKDWFRSIIARLSKDQIGYLGHILGSLMYHLNRKHRRIALRNLKFVNPEWSQVEIGRFVRNVFCNFGMMFIEIIQMNCLTREEILKRITFEGENHVQQALERGRGLIVISAHFGNWEWALQLYPLYFSRTTLGVVQNFEFEFIERWVHSFRTRFGNRFIHKKGALGNLNNELRQNGVVALMIDMTRQKQSVPVTFLGRKATATPAAAMLALRCKSPIIPNFMYRQPDGSLVSRFEPPVPIRRSKDLRADLQFNTQQITDRVEQAILKYPHQWNWMLKRWKDFYPDLYPETEKRLRRIKRKERRGMKSVGPSR